jgi:cation-transporting P-type ATPase F
MHELGPDEVEVLLGTDARDGLSHDEASRRLHRHGPNALPPPERTGPVRRLLAQVANPLIYVLTAAALITLAMREFVDAAVIAAVVVVNVAVGFIQESRAEGALRALMSMTRTTATVSRGGARMDLHAEELVPGDLVHLGEGDRVPADVRIMAASRLRVDESMLTGESHPSAKDTGRLPQATLLADRANIAYAGTLVVTGTAAGLVIATGADTELGRIQRLVGGAATLATPLTRRIARFSVVLTVVILALSVLTFALGLARGEPASEMFTAVIALAVGAIPEGLPAAVTIALAIGVSRMARRRAIVRRLPVAETLGSTTVICSDKTGTLTENRMVVRDVRSAGEGVGDGPDHRLLGAAALCNDATARMLGDEWETSGDPTEAAMVVAAARAGIDVDDLRARHRRVDQIPFSSERAWMATLDASDDGPKVIHVKGAVERVIERSRFMRGTAGPVPLDAEAVVAEARAMAAEGLRVLAVAESAPFDHDVVSEDDVRDLVFLGLQGMMDPPRDEATAAVAECRSAGIRVVMVTGDQTETAQAIGRMMAIAGDREPVAVSGAELSGMPPRELIDRVREVDVIARVSPEQKLQLVEAFQAEGDVVAMTGDGVNDAPALRQANVGVAMGRGGTEVAKEASDIVLADDDFATIAAAVREGRRVFDNITKFIVWTLPMNIAQGMLVLVAVVIGTALPVLPTQILWINMTTAIFLGLPLAVERLEPGAMSRPPRNPSAPLIAKPLLRRMLLVAGVLVAAAFILHEWYLTLGGTEAQAQTLAINVVVAGEAFYLLNCRSLSGSFLRMGVFSNRWVLVGIGVMAGLQALLTYAPPMQLIFGTAAIPAWTWGMVLVAGAAVSAVAAADKAYARRRAA